MIVSPLLNTMILFNITLGIIIDCVCIGGVKLPWVLSQPEARRHLFGTKTVTIDTLNQTHCVYEMRS